MSVIISGVHADDDVFTLGTEEFGMDGSGSHDKTGKYADVDDDAVAWGTDVNDDAAVGGTDVVDDAE